MGTLHNNKNKYQLIDELNNEAFNRITLSFYKYVKLSNLIELRDGLYNQWLELKVLGRIYIAEEGINAQVSIPDYNLKAFKQNLYTYKPFDKIVLKKAIEENISFYKLIIKVKKEIVAYKLLQEDYDM